MQATRLQRSPGLEGITPLLLDPGSALVFRGGRRAERVELLSLHQGMEPVCWWWKRGYFLLCLMEMPTGSTLSHQISFQRGTICTTLLLIKQCLREFEMNCLEMSPNTAPRLRPNKRQGTQPSLGDTIRLQSPSPSLPHTAVSTASSIQCLQLLCSSPAYPSLHQWVYGRRAGNTPAEVPMLEGSHFGPYVSGSNLRESQYSEVQEGSADLVR